MLNQFRSPAVCLLRPCGGSLAGEQQMLLIPLPAFSLWRAGAGRRKGTTANGGNCWKDLALSEGGEFTLAAVRWIGRGVTFGPEEVFRRRFGRHQQGA